MAQDYSANQYRVLIHSVHKKCLNLGICVKKLYPERDISDNYTFIS